MANYVIHGDSLEELKKFRENFFDSVVTDPPYGLEFMGKAWDKYTPGEFQHWCELWAREAYRVLKPGGYLVAFGGTRTYHRLAAGIEDAGFEIRDSLHWIYGSGFPKSMDISKAIDKAAGAEREPGVPGRYAARRPRDEVESVNAYHDGVGNASTALVTAPATEAAQIWKGWGTALKPAHEPIILARKPLSEKTVAANVLKHNTGGINIDDSRVATDGPNETIRLRRQATHVNREAGSWANDRRSLETYKSERPGELIGRWPPNILLSHSPWCDDDTCADDCPASQSETDGATGGCSATCPIAEMDRQSGTSVSNIRISEDKDEAAATFSLGRSGVTPRGHSDSGGASRFFPIFRYQAKAPKKERPVVEGVAAHPTVKPVALMQWLVTLVTPYGGTVLDPFGGSGTTAEACALDGFDCIVIEREPDYVKLINERLAKLERKAA